MGMEIEMEMGMEMGIAMVRRQRILQCLVQYMGVGVYRDHAGRIGMEMVVYWRFHFIDP